MLSARQSSITIRFRQRCFGRTFFAEHSALQWNGLLAGAPDESSSSLGFWGTVQGFGPTHTGIQTPSESANSIAVTSVLLSHRAIADINETFRDTFDCIFRMVKMMCRFAWWPRIVEKAGL